VSDVFNGGYDGVIEVLLPMVNDPADWAKLPDVDARISQTFGSVLAKAFLDLHT
jgi:hypothetical protein